MDSIYEERGSDWSWQVSIVATTRWLQRDQTLPLSAKGVACETKMHHCKGRISTLCQTPPVHTQLRLTVLTMQPLYKVSTNLLYQSMDQHHNHPITINVYCRGNDFYTVPDISQAHTQLRLHDSGNYETLWWTIPGFTLHGCSWKPWWFWRFAALSLCLLKWWVLK